MDNQPTSVTNSNENTIFLNGKQLADVLGVAPASLSQAVKDGYNCGGYPVADWAIETDSGRIKGYEVPEFLVSGEPQDLEKRPNPTEKVPNEVSISPNKGQNPFRKASSVIQNNYSLLPEGEDYVRPAGMIALPMVLKKALDRDTPQSRAVISGLLALLGAITGHAVSDNAIGAGVGASAGLGIAVLMYKYFNPNDNLNHQPLLKQKMVQQRLADAYTNKSNQSKYQQHPGLYIT